MRELGVVQADGIVLGPEPRQPPAAEPPSTASERAEFERQQLRESKLDALRWRIPGTLDADLERFLPSELRNAS